MYISLEVYAYLRMYGRLVSCHGDALGFTPGEGRRVTQGSYRNPTSRFWGAVFLPKVKVSLPGMPVPVCLEQSVLAPAIWPPGGILACGSLLGCPLVTPAASHLLGNAGVSRHGRSDGCAR